jgi:hypothetical protein
VCWQDEQTCLKTLLHVLHLKRGIGGLVRLWFIASRVRSLIASRSHWLTKFQLSSSEARTYGGFNYSPDPSSAPLGAMHSSQLLKIIFRGSLRKRLVPSWLHDRARPIMLQPQRMPILMLKG